MDFITCILILTLLSLSSLFGTQAKARDTERSVDIKALHSHIEAYYAMDGIYPTRDDINDAGWRIVNMPGLDPESLKDPDGTTKSLTAKATDTSYGYQPFSSDDTSCDNQTKDCAKYTLTANLSNGSTFVKQNLN